MTDSELMSANQDFYARHCDTFDENVEENKHEYNQIFEEFVKIQEEVIEAKLREKYTDEQIQAFYQGLESNLKTYEAKDIETVDYLYSMIDFQKFKVKMCMSKARVMKEKNMQSEGLSSDQIVKMSDINIK